MAYELFNVGGMANQTRVSYNRRLLSRAVPNFVHANPSWYRVAPVPTREGKVVNWRRLELVSATTSALTEGTPGAETQLTWSAVNATIDQYGQFSIITDVVETQTIDPQVAEIVEKYGEVMGNSRDQLSRNTLTGGTTIQYASTAGSRSQVGCNMLLTYAEIREAVATLEVNSARRFPDGNAFIGILHPNTKRDIFADSDIISSLQNAGNRGDGNQMFRGMVGDFYGVRFVETSNARVRTSLGLSGMDVYITMIFGQEFMGITDFAAHQAQIIVHGRGSGGVADPLDQRSTIGWKMSFGAAILNQSFGVAIEHGTSANTAA